MVVQRQPVLGGNRLRRDEASRVTGLADPEPTLGRAVAVVVHAWPAGVVDFDSERRATRDRQPRRDHELVRRTLCPVEICFLVRVRGGQLGRARRRERVVIGPPTGFSSPAACARGSGSFWPFGSPGYVGCTNAKFAGLPFTNTALTARFGPSVVFADDRSKSRLKSVRHCAARSVCTTCVPGRKRFDSVS